MPDFNSEDRYLSLQKVARVLGVSVQTLRKWVREGEIPAFWIGSRMKLRESDLKEWIRQNKMRPESGE